jgi:hypothetical protein
VAYESIILGLFTIFRGERLDREKRTISHRLQPRRLHWARPDRERFIPVSERVGDWNWANVQSAGGCCLVVGDQLYFYVSGRRGVPGTTDPGTCSTGLAMLRRDGFVSMSDGSDGRGVRRTETALPRGTRVTRPVTLKGRILFVNARITGEPGRADREGEVIVPTAPRSAFRSAAIERSWRYRGRKRATCRRWRGGRCGFVSRSRTASCTRSGSALRPPAPAGDTWLRGDPALPDWPTSERCSRAGPLLAWCGLDTPTLCVCARELALRPASRPRALPGQTTIC